MGIVRRNIEQEMINFLNLKLEPNGLASEAILRKDARLLMLLAAQACVGIRESGGNNRGKMVELLQETIGRAEGEAWCMSFVQTMIAYAEVMTGKVSPIFVSEGCAQTWLNTDKAQRVFKVPAPGAVVIWKNETTGMGHTGIVSSYNAKGGYFNAIEGNTGGGVDGGKVVRDGGGVYFTKRSIHGDGSMKVRGFLKPF